MCRNCHFMPPRGVCGHFSLYFLAPNDSNQKCHQQSLVNRPVQNKPRAFPPPRSAEMVKHWVGVQRVKILIIYSRKTSSHFLIKFTSELAGFQVRFYGVLVPWLSVRIARLWAIFMKSGERRLPFGYLLLTSARVLVTVLMCDWMGKLVKPSVCFPICEVSADGWALGRYPWALEVILVRLLSHFCKVF